jgi:sensor histidine kinase YesM
MTTLVRKKSNLERYDKIGYITIIGAFISLLLSFLAASYHGFSVDTADNSRVFFTEWGRRFISMLLLWLSIDLLYRSQWHIIVKFVVSIFALLVFYLVTKHTNFVTYSSSALAISARLSLSAILVFSIQYMIKSALNVMQLRFEKERFQKMMLQTELQSLRSKIDPHFLFNALNVLKTMVNSNQPESEKYITHLSDFYRQTLRFNEDILLPLADEINFVKAYLGIMEYRYQNAVHITIDIVEEDMYCLLPTLALQTLVENCFKHNVVSETKPLTIRICSDGSGYIYVINNLQSKFSDVDSFSGQSSEVRDWRYGLEHIRQQYQLLGKEQGLMITSDNEKSLFTIRLKFIKT